MQKANYFIFLIIYYRLFIIKIFFIKLFSINTKVLKKHQALYFLYHNVQNIKVESRTLVVTYKDIIYYLRINSSDIQVFNQIVYFEEYSIAIELLHKYFTVDRNIVVVDLGANIGLTTKYFSTHLPSSTIISVEPDLDNFKILQKNVKNYSNVHPLQCAIWHENRTLFFDRTFRDQENWSRRTVEHNYSGTTVEAMTILQILQNQKLHDIDILKVDVEGAEANIFLKDNDINEILRRTKVVTVEVHPELVSREKIEAILLNNKFRITHCGELLVGVNLNIVKN